MRRRSVLLGVVLVVASWSCGGGPDSILDEGPRVPDAEGIATELTIERVQIDGGKIYPIGDAVESFTTRSHDVTPLLSWKGKYIHIGLDDDGKVAWIAGIGSVVKDKPAYTLYSGVFEQVEDGRAVFEDGTTLKLAPGVDAPEAGETLVTIDPTKDLVTKIGSQ